MQCPPVCYALYTYLVKSTTFIPAYQSFLNFADVFCTYSKMPLLPLVQPKSGLISGAVFLLNVEHSYRLCCFFLYCFFFFFFFFFLFFVVVFFFFFFFFCFIFFFFFFFIVFLLLFFISARNTGIFFLFLHKNMLWYSLETPHRGPSN